MSSSFQCLSVAIVSKVFCFRNIVSNSKMLLHFYFNEINENPNILTKLYLYIHSHIYTFAFWCICKKQFFKNIVSKVVIAHNEQLLICHNVFNSIQYLILHWPPADLFCMMEMVNF